MKKYAILVNGRRARVDADADTPLLWTLREHVGLTGTKFGCGMGVCGACTVHMDGKATRSCILPVSAVGHAAVTTIEGLNGPVADALLEAWVESQVAQCGYCQSGQLMTAAALLSTNQQPTDDQIDAAMTGNLCRCATYLRIRAAIHAAAQKIKDHKP